MRYFIKILFVLTFTLAAFAEKEAQEPFYTKSEASQTADKSDISESTNVIDTDQNDTSTSVASATSYDASLPENLSEKETPLEDIREIRPAVSLPTETWKVVTLSSLILVFLLLLLYFFKKHRSHKQNISVVPIDPYHKALQQLETSLQLIQSPDQRPFATGITDAVREYLAAVFHLPAPECTTEEVLEQLPNVALLTEETRQTITHLLQQCDLAKFTKLQFDQPERLKLYHQAKEFIQSADKLIQLQNVNSTEQ